MSDNFLEEAEKNNEENVNNSFLPNMDKIIEIFPNKLTNHFRHIVTDDIIEITMELGRAPEVKHAGGRVEFLGNIPVLYKDLSFINEVFPQVAETNYIEIPETLHRIKVSRDFQKKIFSITCSIGRFATEAIDYINDVVTNGNSILFIGRHKSGKTTRLREVAILLASMEKKVAVVDPYKDILGGDNSHPALQNICCHVGEEDMFKKDLMLEACEIYSPDVLIVDELITKQEIQTVKSITEKGITVIASMLGTTLEALMKNPTLFDTVGALQTVNFSETEDNDNIDMIKTPSFKRIHAPIFKTLIEILNVNSFAVYQDVEQAVDGILDRMPIQPQMRGAGFNNMSDDRYKDTLKSDDGRKDKRVKSMKAIVQESFFHGASWLGQNFIA